jgi:hypothetical protein
LLYLAVKGKTLLQNKKIIALGAVIIVGFVLFLLTIGKSLFIKPNLNLPISWSTFLFVGEYLNPLLLVIFFIGLIIFLMRIVIGLDLVKTNKETRSDLFLLLILVIWFGFFAFYIRGGDDRWLLMTSLPIFIIISKGLMLIYNFVKKYSKAIAIIAVLLLLGIGAYYEIQHADQIIKMKKDSYLQVEQAGLWIKENSNKNAVVFSVSAPQTAYYSERETVNYAGFKDQAEFEEQVKSLKPEYLTISVFESHPSWIFAWPQIHNDTILPVKAYYLDAEQKQMALVIYKFS